MGATYPTKCTEGLDYSARSVQRPSRRIMSATLWLSSSRMCCCTWMSRAMDSVLVDSGQVSVSLHGDVFSPWTPMPHAAALMRLMMLRGG